jgi:DNA-directed RNA polymerase subunit RPC12/RpoP
MCLSEFIHELVRPTIPACPRCGTPMWVVHVEHGLGQDKRTYECPQCEHAVKLKIKHQLVLGES